jgi:hypothetical protein
MSMVSSPVAQAKSNTGTMYPGRGLPGARQAAHPPLEISFYFLKNGKDISGVNDIC